MNTSLVKTVALVSASAVVSAAVSFTAAFLMHQPNVDCAWQTISVSAPNDSSIGRYDVHVCVAGSVGTDDPDPAPPETSTEEPAPEPTPTHSPTAATPVE